LDGNLVPGIIQVFPPSFFPILSEALTYHAQITNVNRLRSPSFPHVYPNVSFRILDLTMLIESSDLSNALRKTAIETTHTLARQKGPGGAHHHSKRGKTVSFCDGLQTVSAHSQYLGRWSMMSKLKPIPSVRINNIPSEPDKEHLLLLYYICGYWYW